MRIIACNLIGLGIASFFFASATLRTTRSYWSNTAAAKGPHDYGGTFRSTVTSSFFVAAIIAPALIVVGIVLFRSS